MTKEKAGLKPGLFSMVAALAAFSYIPACRPRSAAVGALTVIGVGPADILQQVRRQFADGLDRFAVGSVVAPAGGVTRHAVEECGGEQHGLVSLVHGLAFVGQVRAPVRCAHDPHIALALDSIKRNDMMHQFR